MMTPSAKLRIVAFEPRHLLDIDHYLITHEELRVIGDSNRTLGPAFSIVEAGRAIGSAGIVIDGKTGRVWAVLSHNIRGKPFALHRTVKRGMEQIVEQHRLERLEASCHARFMAAQQWLERLGFRLTNSRTNLGGEPYLRYVRKI